MLQYFEGDLEIGGGDGVFVTPGWRIAVGQPPLVGEVAVVYRWIYLYKKIREGTRVLLLDSQLLTPSQPVVRRKFGPTYKHPFPPLHNRLVHCFHHIQRVKLMATKLGPQQWREHIDREMSTRGM